MTFEYIPKKVAEKLRKGHKGFSEGVDTCNSWTGKEEDVECHCGAWAYNQALDDVLKEAVWIDEEDISGALARGYCYVQTEKEVMNPTLCSLQLVEILKLLQGEAE